MSEVKPGSWGGAWSLEHNGTIFEAILQALMVCSDSTKLAYLSMSVILEMACTAGRIQNKYADFGETTIVK